MRYVLDLDGDWFAMSDQSAPYYPPGHPHHFAPRPVAVGDVLASVRTIEYEGNPPALAWAFPPFVRVVEVLPIVKYGEHSTVGRYVVVQVEPGSDRAFALDNGGGFPVTSQEVALPDARPGGWAVRVEPIRFDPRSYLSDGTDLLALLGRPPVVDGPPLNKEAQP